jgi:formamidopyrimidine-DNA glycosylase
MSGSLLLDSRGASDPYNRTVFHLDNGAGLYFRDPRKLGLLWLVTDENTVVGKLGPEPLDPAFTAADLGEWSKKYSAPIKAVLCDQRFLAGIGNMYADEALFAASLHPLRATNSLSADEVERLYKAIHRVLEAQSIFKVAHRIGKPCPVCGTIIERIPIRQRGAYFCPNCQRNS